jgi:hypothetical protein
MSQSGTEPNPAASACRGIFFSAYRLRKTEHRAGTDWLSRTQSGIMPCRIRWNSPFFASIFSEYDRG